MLDHWPAVEFETGRSRPWLTWSGCAIVVLVAIGIAGTGGDSAVTWWGWQPAVDLWQGKPWALVTSALVHLNAVHLAFNLYWLWVLGRAVESVLGPLRLGAFIIASALVSSAAQLAVSDETGIGSSGVAYALFGLAWMLSRYRRDLGIRMPRQIVQLFAVWLLVGTFGTYLGLVNFGNAAHLAGGLFGICAGLAFTDRWNRAGVVGLRSLLAWGALIAFVAPWSPAWNEARARSAYRRADYAAAIEWLERSLRRGGDPAWITQTKAMVHWQAGAKDEVRADLDALRKIDPKGAEVFERQIRGEER